MRNRTISEIEYKPLDYSLLKRLLLFLKPYRRFVFLAILLTMLVSALGPLRPYFSKIAIDDYIGNSDTEGLVTICVLIFILLVVHGIFQFALTYLMQWVGQKVLLDIRMKIFDHIHSRSLSFYDKNPVGRLVTRVTNDVEVLNQLFSSGVVMIIADFLLIFWLIAFMFYTSWTLALITLTILPFLILASFFFRKKIRVLFREIRLQLSKMNSFLNEYISGIATVKLFNREAEGSKEFDTINIRQKELNVKTIFYYALFFPIIEMLSAIALGLIIWYTAGNILSGEMTIGILIAFTQYAEMFFRPVRDLTEKYTTLQSAMASSERIFELLDNEESLPDTGQCIEMPEFMEEIEFRNITFSYEPSKPVLKDISFKVKKGETLAIVGPTGSGKTTLINLLTRFYDFQEGGIFIDGTSIRDFCQKSMRSRMALVMQDVFLFSGSVSDNISLGNDEIDTEEISKAAVALGASDFIEKLPDKYKSELKERGQTLSAGQRQLIAFCRAYASDPDILILDEATSNIDTETELIIEKSLDKLLTKSTSIVIAHRLSTIKRADRIIVVHKGCVRETGTHKELLEQGGVYSRLYKLQYKKAK